MKDKVEDGSQPFNPLIDYFLAVVDVTYLAMLVAGVMY